MKPPAGGCGKAPDKIPDKIWFEPLNPYFCTPKNKGKPF
jgi:hypothetical protein